VGVPGFINPGNAWDELRRPQLLRSDFSATASVANARLF
jgi:hypothetical protein